MKLLNVKSIVSLALTITFAGLALLGKITPDNVVQVYMIVIAFYFGTQHEKKK